MAKQKWILAAVLACSLVASPALAIDLGDDAPPLKIKKWVKGDAVDLAKGKDKNVFVVEFWATWCGPCIKGIPHLTELQKEYKDKGVVFVGISAEKTSVVKKFVEKQGDKMGYAVAVDKKRATNRAYMKASGINYIPYAFIVDKGGKLVWRGSPYDIDEPLEQIVEGKYDIEAAKKAAKKAAEAAKKAEKAMKLMGEYFDMVSDGEKPKKAAKLGKKVFKLAKGDPQLLNALAWTILTEPKLEGNRDLKLAKKAAKAANKAAGGKDAAIMDTYARALFDTGDKAEAIELQKKAIELAKDPRMKADLEKTLKRYKEEASDEEV